MTNVIAIIVIVLIVGAAVTYIVRSKRKGVKCIGCPEAGSCSKKEESSCGCGCEDNRS